ncbi:MAG: hypothetical protein ACRDJP_07190 [Actinomycetota bacterium]
MRPGGTKTMIQTLDHTDQIDATDHVDHTDEAVAALHGRAVHLRHQARTMHPLVSSAYRRRAAELELGAWALAIRIGRAPADCPRTVTAA